MTLPDRITTAVAAILSGSALPGDPNVVAGIELAVNGEETVRVIVSTTSCQLRTMLLPGIYDVTGEVVVHYTIDTQADEDADLTGDFRDLCAAVEDIVGQKYVMLQNLTGQDSTLHAYSWNLTGQDSFMNQRAMGARYTWSCFARQQSHNPN